MRELGAAAILACLLGVVAGAAGAGAFSPVREDASARFELRVRPLLQRRCVSCHGPTVSQSGLRLDTAAGLKVGGRRGPAVIPGDPGSSRLFRAVSGREPNLKMPPEGALSPQERADLEGWIRAGAIWPETTGGPPRLKGDAARSHWSFLPMRSVRPPATRRSGWARNPVDQFILSRLEREKWEPAPAAGRRELLRRVTFDLTGLPPTPEEVQVFLTDGRPDAYERVVDRLLTSPRYGERWARYWLDLVRYADTNGYERDGEKPHSWKYRDYVIRSLNEDKRYDRFILEQLAGDELPDRSEETVTGTGFLRLGT
ncbi:MAG: DUF1549 domain-containing protein, partial [SAR202 cluster bacterium]|nr:DUF1549 domain-containing protein [SAR202 cluster bacterium]